MSRSGFKRLALRITVAAAATVATALGSGIAHAAPTAPAAGGVQYCVTQATSDQVECHESAERVQGLFLILQVWDDFNFQGVRLDVYSSVGGCTSAYDNELDKRIANLAEGGWNNAIRSWNTVGQCRVRFYDPFNFGSPMSLLSNANVDCRDMRTCFGSVNWDRRASSLALT